MLWLLLSISSVNCFINCLVNNCGILWYKIVSLLTQIFLCLGYFWANGFWNFRFIYRGWSGNGTFAIQIAKHQGLKVLWHSRFSLHFASSFIGFLWSHAMLSGIYFISWSSRSEEKLAVCEDLRADVCINYKIEDFVAKGREETGGKSMFFTTVNVIGFVLINVSIALPYFNF
jgi:hypothetical protein